VLSIKNAKNDALLLSGDDMTAFSECKCCGLVSKRKKLFKHLRSQLKNPDTLHRDLKGKNLNALYSVQLTSTDQIVQLNLSLRHPYRKYASDHLATKKFGPVQALMTISCKESPGVAFTPDIENSQVNLDKCKNAATRLAQLRAELVAKESNNDNGTGGCARASCYELPGNVEQDRYLDWLDSLYDRKTLENTLFRDACWELWGTYRKQQKKTHASISWLSLLTPDWLAATAVEWASVINNGSNLPLLVRSLLCENSTFENVNSKMFVSINDTTLKYYCRHGMYALLVYFYTQYEDVMKRYVPLKFSHDALARRLIFFCFMPS
jgi:hypothetical protein